MVGGSAAAFVASRAIGSPHWTPNGLSLSENRKLFLSESPDEIRRLVIKGLLATVGALEACCDRLLYESSMISGRTIPCEAAWILELAAIVRDVAAIAVCR